MENNLTVIIPVIDYKDNKDLLAMALESVANSSLTPQEVIVVAPKSEKVKLSTKKSPLNVRLVTHEGDSSFQAQINLGVEETQTKHFTILQMDDTLLPNYIRLIETYTAKGESDVYLPIVVNSNAEGFVGFQNEIIWANGFANEIGSIDFDTMSEYHELFTINGIVMSKESFKYVGGFKPSMKAKFDTEFLLRVLYNGMKISVIPKVGYAHKIGRQNSISENLKHMISNEYKFWVETALKEHAFSVDREVTFEN